MTHFEAPVLSAPPGRANPAGLPQGGCLAVRGTKMTCHVSSLDEENVERQGGPDPSSRPAGRTTLPPPELEMHRSPREDQIPPMCPAGSVSRETGRRCWFGRGRRK
jgi:hypothetical protein